MAMLPVITLLSAFLFYINSVNAELKICSFNIQTFGKSKAGKPHIISYLSKILIDYDLCLIQEIREAKSFAKNILMNALNGLAKRYPQLNRDYSKVVSARLGRTRMKEEYAFIFNKKKVNITSSYVVKDQKGEYKYNLFERPPFVVRIKLMPNVAGKVKDFFIVGIHTKPDDAPYEIGNLTTVFQEAKKTFKIPNGIMMGDFNADCGYFSKTAKNENPLRKDTQFVWVIKDDEYTNVADSCSYDRIVVSKEMKVNVKNAMARRYDSEKGFKLNLNQTKEISDHYPIQFTIL